MSRRFLLISASVLLSAATIALVLSAGSGLAAFPGDCRQTPSVDPLEPGASFQAPIVSGAQAAEDYTYMVRDNTAIVTGYVGVGGAITVPGAFGQYPTVAIGGGAFYGISSITSVTVPNGVSTIGAGAFSYCYGLVSVSLPDSVAYIEDAAFFHCTSLADFSTGNGLLYIPAQCFAGCTGLIGIELPESLQYIGISAFEGCSGLRSMAFPGRVNTVDSNAFDHCTSLANVFVPACLTAIAAPNFQDCGSLLSFDVDPSNTAYSSLDGVLYDYEVTRLHVFPAGKGGGFILPQTITAISDSAFNGCRLLTSVVLDESLVTISDRAFIGCSGLTAMEVPANVAFIGSYAWANCHNLTSIRFLGAASPQATFDVIFGDRADLRGHAYLASDFPAPGGVWMGLTMGEYIPVAPGTPTNLAALPGTRQAVLSWNAPASDGGAPIDYYLVYQDGFVLDLRPTGTSVNVTDLMNGHRYSFRVAAHNIAGNGTKSDAMDADLPNTAPGSPRQVWAFSGVNMIDLTWLPPQDDGGSNITGYRIYRILDNGPVFLADVSPALGYYYDLNLTAGKSYTYCVAAVNAIGPGPNSAQTSATPSAPQNDTTLLYAVTAMLLLALAVVVILQWRKKL